MSGRQPLIVICVSESKLMLITHVLLDACEGIDLAVKTGETKYMETGHHRGMIANEHIRIGSNSYEKYLWKIKIIFAKKYK